MTLALAKREKYVLAFGAAFVFLFLFNEVGVSRAVAYREKLERQVVKERAAREKVAELAADYRRLSDRQKGAAARLAGRQADFRLFAFLDLLAGQAGLKSAVQYMKPAVSPIEGSPYKSSTVEMKLSGISMEQLAGFIHMIESSPNGVSIRRMSVTATGKEERFLDAVFLASTLER